MNGNTQTGRPPTAAEEILIDVAGKLTPDKSIERLDTQGKYLFSTVSIVGILLTGFGIFSPLGANVLRNPWLLIPIALACLSLAFAMIGLTPMVHKVDVGDITSVRNYYNHIIRERGRYIFWGSVAFALSLLSVAIVLTVILRPSPLMPAISTRLAGSGEKATLTSKIELQELPRSGIVETSITGFKDTKTGPQQTLLFKDVTRADQSGKISIQSELDKVNEYKWFVITNKVTSDNKLLCEKTVEVRR